LRLVNGSSPCSGRVEVFHNEKWGTVCDAGWDLQDAQVVCRELECGYALKASGGACFGRGVGPIWLERTDCTGREESLRQCPRGLWVETSCDHSQDASVECAVIPISDPPKIRLVNGFSRCSGRIEVFHNQQWGTVCEDGWDQDNVQVVCNELGCGDALLVSREAYFGRGNGPIWLLRVRCDGTENAISDCPYRKSRISHICSHDHDAGIVCSELRLVNGSNRCSGRVEVLHKQQWGTVCDAGWDSHDAQVVCRERSCGNVAKAIGGALYGRGSSPIWLKGVNCTGEEASLSDCGQSAWEDHSCDHSQDASVECS
ncbi:deleted in malignant brain tumors 1 protein-like, partial [Sceloporus undulatus]|uniref:deleted in malignant brain tumors 1 protein-like n=1 Tax=Sceloporus undulatus TaxID=8520 RepID=UPI001C4AB75B